MSDQDEIARLKARVSLLERALRAMTGNFRMSLLLVSSEEGRADGMDLVRDAEKILHATDRRNL